MSDPELVRLIKETEASMERLDKLQSKSRGPFLQRLVKSFRQSGPNAVNIALAGSVLAVAAGRLNMKYEHQAEREEWEREKAKLVRERDEAQSRLDGATGRLQAASTAGGRNQLAKAVNQFLSETRLGGEEGDIVAAASAPPISEKKGRFMI